MELKDFIITPFFLLIIYSLAYLVKSRATNTQNRRFFIPALTVKIIGALAVGFIYQFYYRGGDTFTYYQLGSAHIWDAFLDSPVKALKLIFSDGTYTGDIYQYASRIYTFGDSASYFVVRVAGVFGIITLNTYSSIAILFALFSFSGVWALYITICKIYPRNQLQLSFAILFFPSLFFWGSGLLKDTLTIGALGWMTFFVYRIFFESKANLFTISALILSAYVLLTIKIYILLCIVPALFLWIFLSKFKKINSAVLRALLFPLVIIVLLGSSYFLVFSLGQQSDRYSLDSFTKTAEETAKWNYFVSNREQGSGYTLGDFDFTPAGMLRKFPNAVWVSLFRPYLWEVRNPVMLLAAMENAILLGLFLVIIWRSRVFGAIRVIQRDPFLLACFIFTVTFSFAVGIATYNFGSLVRYRIPVLPFFITFLLILNDQVNKSRKLLPLDSTE